MKSLVAIVLIMVAGFVTAIVIAPSDVNPGFRDAAAVLAFAGLAAVAIERVIEGFFTVLSGPLGEWWPLSTVKAEFDTFEKQTKELFDKHVTSVTQALETAKSTATAGSDEWKKLDSALNNLVDRKDALEKEFQDARKKLAPGSARLQRVAEVGAELSERLSDGVEVLGNAGTAVNSALKETTALADRALLVIDSFEDNPARRVASLGLGSALGAVIAGGVGLNLFQATLGDPTTGAGVPALLQGTLGLVLTGVILGLGASPAHEIIKTLQEIKKNRQGSERVSRPSPGSVSRGRVAGGQFLVFGGANQHLLSEDPSHDRRRRVAIRRTG